MAMQEIGLGVCPSDENAVQLGGDHADWKAAREQCNRYRAMIARMFGKAAEDLGIKPIRLSIISEHGEYIDLVIRFDDNNSKEICFAFFVEANLPNRWSSERSFSLKDYEKWVIESAG